MSMHNSATPEALTYGDAVFLAALPYRKGVQAAGGFAAARAPLVGLDGRLTLDWQFLRRHFRAADLRRAQAQAKRCAQLAPQLCTGETIAWLNIWDPDYPPALRAIYDPPPILFCANAGGGLPVAAEPADVCRAFAAAVHFPEQVLCVVGTRQAEPLAVAACHELLANSRSDGTTVLLSGLALGIDRAVHAAAIDAGWANMAVLGAGLRHAGPRANLDLPQRARKLELPFWLVSEFPPDCQARAAFFPRRNRILAGLASRVALMQAPARSGALITAHFALEEGRDVSVFDHAVLDEAGDCNAGGRELLKAGARRIELPALERRLVSEPPMRTALRGERLALRRASRLKDGLQWLGGRHYLRKRSGGQTS